MPPGFINDGSWPNFCLRNSVTGPGGFCRSWLHTDRYLVRYCCCIKSSLAAQLCRPVIQCCPPIQMAQNLRQVLLLLLLPCRLWAQPSPECPRVTKEHTNCLDRSKLLSLLLLPLLQGIQELQGSSGGRG